MSRIQLTHFPFFQMTLHFLNFSFYLSPSIAWHFVYNLLNLFMSSEKFEVPLSLFVLLKYDTEELNKKLPRLPPASFIPSQLLFQRPEKRLKFRPITYNDSSVSEMD